MRIRFIKPHNFGPFIDGTRLDIHPEVTVLTGANDVGKTSLLTLIRQICASDGQKNVEESEIHRMEILRAKQSWKSSDVGASVELEVLQGFEKQASGNQAGAILSADVNISPEKWSVGNCLF